MSRRRVLLLVLINPRGPIGPNVTYAFSSDRVAFDVGGLELPGTVIPFQARISGQDDIVIDRQASVWPFDRAPTQRAGVVSLLNGDRALDDCLHGAYRIARDWKYQLRWCWDDEAADPDHDIATTQIWQSGLIDSVSTTDGDRRIVLTLADPLAYLDVPLQTDLYPDNAPNAAARGKPKPVTLGTARFAPGVLRDTDELGADKWIYDLHDDRVLQVTAAYDKGDIFVANTDWKYPADRRGIQLVNKPDRPVTATLAGQYLPGAQTMHTDFVTDPWPGGAPTGWVRNTGSKVAGGWRMNAAGATFFGQASAAVLSSGVSHRVRVVCSAAASGAVFVTPFAIGDIDAVAISAPGTYDAIFPAVGGDRTVRFLSASACDVTIASVTIEEIHDTARLPRFVSAIAQRKWLSGSLDTAAITALDTAAPYLLGTYIDTPITALTLLRRALDGWCGWVTSTRAGSLTVGRLRKRGGTTGTVRLGRGQIITVRRRTDTAPGLATRLAGMRNHRVHSDSDIATSVDDALRAELQAEYTVKTGSTAMPTDYAHADGADPMPTLLQDADQLQAAADYVTDLFGSGAMTWYEVDAAISAEVADGLEMGDWIHVTHPVAGLDAGKWLCLMGATIRFRGRRATLTLLEIPE